MNRGHDSPMDFEYTNGAGPSDPSSPFNPHNVRDIIRREETNQSRKRHLDSPMASPSKSVPQFIAPNSKPFLISTPYAKPLPPADFGSPVRQLQFSQDTDFTTPRKTESIFSSDAEDSPMAGFELPPADPNTPEPPSKISKQKTPSNSIFSSLSISKKSGRGELSRGKFSDGAFHKVQKRRQRSHQRYGSNDYSSDSNSDTPPQHHRSSRKAIQAASVAQPQSSWADTHRDIPTILSGYLQLIVNLLIGCLGLYVLSAFVWTIQRDVDKRVLEYSAEVQHEIDVCSHNYFANRCSPETRLPAMEVMCGEWKLCGERDPMLVGRARVSAETFAEIINSFIEPISYKTMFFCFILLFGCIFISNFAFGFFRAKTLNHPHPIMAAAMPPIANHIPWPPTPSQQQGYAGGYSVYNTPYATPAPIRKVDDAGGAIGTGKRTLGWR